MKKIGISFVALFAASAALAQQGMFGGYPTATPPLTGNETVAADTNLSGGAYPQTEKFSVNTLAGYLNGLPTGNNILIGGDAGTNLWQRGTAGTATTTTVAFNSADRWAIWSGTNTEVKLIRSTTAADLPAGYQAAFKLQRTASQTGVVQMCMAQPIETASSYQLAGQTAELSFNAYTGATFSAASSNMTAYIIYGTGTDEGIAKLAYGLNAGGGGSSGWTGQANATAAVISLGAVSTAGRYAAFASIPSTATEVAVALCYTPVGTAGATDYIAFAGIQLRRASQSAAFVSSTVGYSSATTQISAFERRPLGLEAALQYRFAYKVTETAAVTPVGLCAVSTTSLGLCYVQFPVVMRGVPTATYATGFAMTVAAQTSLVTCTGNGTPSAVASTALNAFGATVTCTSAAGFGAAGTVAQLFSNNGSGALTYSAEVP